MELQIHTFLGEDLKNSGWTASIGNTVSRPYQYLLGGRKVNVIDSKSLAEVKTVWNDFAEKRFMSALLKVVAIATLIWFSIPLTLCFKGLSYILTSKPPEGNKDKLNGLGLDFEDQKFLRVTVKSKNASGEELSLELDINTYNAFKTMYRLSDPQEEIEISLEQYEGIIALIADSDSAATVSSEDVDDSIEISTSPSGKRFVTLKSWDDNGDQISVAIPEERLTELKLTENEKLTMVFSQERYALLLKSISEPQKHVSEKDELQFAIIESYDDRTFISTNTATDWFSVVLTNLDSLNTDTSLLVIMAPKNAIAPTEEMLNSEQLKKFSKIIFLHLLSSSIKGATLVESDTAALNDTSGAKLFLIFPPATSYLRASASLQQFILNRLRQKKSAEIINDMSEL